MSATLVRLLAALALVAACSAYLKRPKWLKETRPEMWMSTVQLCRREGFDVETHTFESSDGYLLVLHRIAASRNGTKGTTPVLIGHGLCSSDEQWVTRGPTGLVFNLAEKGYDVWLANYRGSFYSRKHKTLTTKDHDFWDFSWHDNGVIDQAESIDYILKLTGQPDLIVIGHSMSSSAQVVLLAERPEYNKKVRGQILLAPPIYFRHAKGFLAYSTNMVAHIPGMREMQTTYVENDSFPGLDRPFPNACFTNFGGFKPKLAEHCKRVINFVMGNLHEPVDMYQLQLIMHHYPAGSSVRQIYHYSQLGLSGKFQKYDFGEDRNLELYGQKTPLEYNLTNVRTPTYIAYTLGDGTVSWEDAEDFAKELQPGVLRKLYRIPAKDYAHIDYLIASDAVELLYVHMYDWMEEIKNF